MNHGTLTTRLKNKCKKKLLENTPNILMDKIFLFAKVFWSRFTYTHDYIILYYICIYFFSFSSDSHKFLSRLQ